MRRFLLRNSFLNGTLILSSASNLTRLSHQQPTLMMILTGASTKTPISSKNGINCDTAPQTTTTCANLAWLMAAKNLWLQSLAAVVRFRRQMMTAMGFLFQTIPVLAIFTFLKNRQYRDRIRRVKMSKRQKPKHQKNLFCQNQSRNYMTFRRPKNLCQLLHFCRNINSKRDLRQPKKNWKVKKVCRKSNLRKNLYWVTDSFF